MCPFVYPFAGIWQSTSKRKDYHQTCLWQKYNACLLTNPAMVRNSLMARLMPPILFKHA